MHASTENIPSLLELPNLEDCSIEQSLRNSREDAHRPAYTEQAYRDKIQPRLAEVTVPAISKALGISRPYATDIRAGRRRPHPRHWLTLAQLVGDSHDE